MVRFCRSRSCPPWPAVSCHGVQGFAFCRPFPDSPRALSSASVRGLFLCHQPCKNHGSVRGYGQLPKAAPAAVFFRRLTMRQKSTIPPHHIAGACRSATKSGLLLRSPKDCAYLMLELFHPKRAAFKTVSPAKRNKTQCYFVAFIGRFIERHYSRPMKATKFGLLLRSPFVSPFSSFQ